MAKSQKRFTQDFQDEAVRLVETSGRSRRAIAEDLGVGLSDSAALDRPPSRA